MEDQPADDRALRVERADGVVDRGRAAHRAGHASPLSGNRPSYITLSVISVAPFTATIGYVPSNGGPSFTSWSICAFASVNDPLLIVKLVPARLPVPLISVCDANAASRSRLGSQWSRSRSVA